MSHAPNDPPSESQEPLDLFSQLQRAAGETQEGPEEGLSLEELSQSYARVTAAEVVSDVETTADTSDTRAADADASSSHEMPLTPRAIVEAILFVGRPDNTGIPAQELARLMRGVSPSEVQQIIDELNQSYRAQQRAMRIVERHDGYHTALAEDLEFVRERFYGRTREVTLNQSAIDCLALVAYQPGVTREQLEQQRGQASGGVLNQLVRRRLIEIQRKGEGAKKVPHYYPTEKLLELAGLMSLDDLPQVEELDGE